MKTEVILHICLGICSAIIFLREIYKAYRRLSLADIIISLLLILTGPIILITLLILQLEKITILKKK